MPEQIDDVDIAKLLAPEKAPFCFETKRATLEQTCYEVFNRNNVSLVNLKSNLVQEIVLQGAITSDDSLCKLDILVL